MTPERSTEPTREMEAVEHAPVPHAADDLGFPLPPPAKIGAGKLVLVSVLGLCVVGGAFAWGIVPRLRARSALEHESQARNDGAPRVEFIRPKVIESDQAVVLPGSVRPLEETVLYPRVTGYVRSWKVDLGDSVKEGDILAEIETPDLDQELALAKAELAQAVAGRGQSKVSLDYSKRDAGRYAALRDAGVASDEQLDEKKARAEVDRASIGVADANIVAKKAAVTRLEELKSFASVVAPFSGTVTQRSIDRGALVTTGTGTPLFRISATDPIKVFIAVPQDLAPTVSAGLSAKVTVREFPSETFVGKVARTSRALDPATRTLTTEVHVPNAKNRLLAGMAAKVALTLPAPHKVIEIPGTAIVTDAKGVRVAIVDGDDTLRFVPVVIERDTGSTILVSQGLDGSERVVKIATGSLAEGTVVQPSESAPPAAP